MLERIVRVADLHDADELDRDTWANSTPRERLAAVESIRRATLALYGTSVRGVERVLVVADAPSRALRRRRTEPDEPARDDERRSPERHEVAAAADVGRDVTADEKVSLLVFDPGQEVIERWVP